MSGVASERAGVQTPDIPPVYPVTPGPAWYRWQRGVSWAKQVPFLILLAGFSVLFVYPFLWLISASLKPRSDVFNNVLIPQHWRFYNYVEIWHAAPFLRWFFNSAYITLLAAVLVTFASALTAFAFAYFRFPLRNLLFGCVLATMMLPGVVTMIPVYLIWHHIGLSSSQIPLWAPNLFGSAFYIFLQRQFFLGIPREYFEAARMDGDNYLTMFWRIALPLAKPALIVTFLFEFKAKWMDLMTPLIYLHSYHSYTVPLGLYVLLGVYSPAAGGNGDYELIMAALVLSTLPMLLIFAFGQRYFVRGITLQGRKG
ncbi:MAG TPA: carbohydrate ABC transporter permease [Gaiellaceae bacterium]|nr:carbohydrate ABC transporter permease [Gaiellaceae bacterium]